MSRLDFTQNLEEATDAITLGRRHSWLEWRVFHYPLPTLMSRNFRLPCTIELQPLSFTPLKMRKVEPGIEAGKQFQGRQLPRQLPTSIW